MAIYDPIVDLFSQDEVSAPHINPNASSIGGDQMHGAFAKREADALWQQGQNALAERQGAAAAMSGQGAAAVQQGNARAGVTDAMGAAGLAAGQGRAGAADAAGQAIQSNQGAAAGQLTQQAQGAQGRVAPAVNLGAANASAATGTQAMSSLGANANALGAAAKTPAAQTANQGALGANAGALGSQAATLQGMAQTPQAQTANAQALGAAGQTGAAQQGNAGALRDFYQQGPGKSLAEIQLNQGSQAAMASNLALARSGRGGANAGAERQALFANAAQQQDTNQSMGLLRAKEADDFRNRQLQAMGLETGALGTARGQDIAGLSAQTQALGQARGQDIGAMQAATGALGQQTTALGTQGQMLGQARGQDLQALGLQTGALGQQGSLANQQQQIGAQTALGVSGQQLAQGAQNDALTSNLSGIAAQRQAAGDQAALGAMGIGNQAIGQGQQFAVGMGGLGNQSVATGQQANAAMGGLANQAAGQGYSTDLGYQGMGNQLLTNQANLNMNLEALKSGQQLQAGMANAGFDQARDSGILGMGSGVAALGFLASDVRAKEDIAPMGSGDGGQPPYSAIVEQNKGYQAQLAATQANQNAQKGAEAQAAAPTDTGMSKGDKMAALGIISNMANPPAPQIPQYQPPQMLGLDPNYVTSDERAKQQALVDGENEGARKAAEWLTRGGPQPPSLVYQTGKLFSEDRGGQKMSPRDIQQYLDAIKSPDRAAPASPDAAPTSKPAPSKIPDSKRRIITAGALGLPEGETDLRAASNSTYNYKDPSMPGAASGRQVGPMAQDLLRTDAAPLVREQPNGMLGVDGPRSGLVALGAVGEQQRRTDELERRMAALGVRSAA